MFCGKCSKALSAVLGLIVVALVLTAIGAGGPATAVGSALTGGAIVGYQLYASRFYGA